MENFCIAVHGRLWYICMYVYINALLSYTGEYTEDKLNLIKKDNIVFDISRKIAKMLNSEMVVNGGTTPETPEIVTYL